MSILDKISSFLDDLFGPPSPDNSGSNSTPRTPPTQPQSPPTREASAPAPANGQPRINRYGEFE